VVNYLQGVSVWSLEASLSSPQLAHVYTGIYIYIPVPVYSAGAELGGFRNLAKGILRYLNPLFLAVGQSHRRSVTGV
jgi:hypothetical protein